VDKLWQCGGIQKRAAWLHLPGVHLTSEPDPQPDTGTARLL